MAARALALLAWVSLASVSLTWATPAWALTAKPTAPAKPAGAADRDSLMREIRQYRVLIRSLSDSLSRDESGLRLSPDQRVVLEENIVEITRAVESIGSELKQLEFQVKDNRISLVNEAGDGIVIAIPENLDERVSQGIEALTQAILKELPDSSAAKHGRHFDWTSFLPRSSKPDRRIVDGNLVRVGQSLAVKADEDVRGNVVVVFGDCEVAGRVDGNVVAVIGGLRLVDGAEVTGTVVAVGGHLEQEPGSVSGNAVALDWFNGGPGAGLGRLLGHRVLVFVVCQGLFILTLLAAIIAVLASPRVRFENALGRLRAAPGPSLGAGLVLWLVGPAAVAALSALLIITVIGVPVAFLLALVVVAVVVLGLTVAGVAVGARLCPGCRSRSATVVVGLSVLHLVPLVASVLNLTGAAPALTLTLFAAGFVIVSVALAFGLGALALSKLGALASGESS